LVNQSYRVARAGRTYSLRVAADRAQLERERDWECRVLACAAAAGLAPKVLCCAPTPGILVLEWVAGRAWTPAETRRPARIRTMAALLRRVHALPIPEPARVRDPAAWIAGYGAALTRLGAARALERTGVAGVGAPSGDVLGTAAPGVAAPRSEELRRAALGRLERWAASGSSRAALCHSDLHRFNVAGGARPVLLDWEYAHVTDPFWDLAGWIANNDWGDRCAARLLSAYLGRAALPQETERLELLVWLYDYVCLQWSELYSCQGAGAPDPALVARAEQLAARIGAAPGGRAPRVAAH
jgi:aminoglycoside phosphotransferase (APT) family kinase protein